MCFSQTYIYIFFTQYFTYESYTRWLPLFYIPFFIHFLSMDIFSPSVLLVQTALLWTILYMLKENVWVPETMKENCSYRLDISSNSLNYYYSTSSLTFDIGRYFNLWLQIVENSILGSSWVFGHNFSKPW